MKRLVIAMFLGLLAVLTGCSTVNQQSAAATLQALQTQVVQGCMVVQPTLMSVAALDPQVSVAAATNGLFCATASTVTVTSVQTLIATGIPALDNAVQQSALIPANQKPIVIAALGVFQLTVTNALAVYQNAQAAAAAKVTATPPVAASAVSATAPASSTPAVGAPASATAVPAQ